MKKLLLVVLFGFFFSCGYTYTTIEEDLGDLEDFSDLNDNQLLHFYYNICDEIKDLELKIGGEESKEIYRCWKCYWWQSV